MHVMAQTVVCRCDKCAALPPKERVWTCSQVGAAQPCRRACGGAGHPVWPDAEAACRTRGVHAACMPGLGRARTCCMNERDPTSPRAVGDAHGSHVVQEVEDVAAGGRCPPSSWLLWAMGLRLWLGPLKCLGMAAAPRSQLTGWCGRNAMPAGAARRRPRRAPQRQRHDGALGCAGWLDWNGWLHDRGVHQPSPLPRAAPRPPLAAPTRPHAIAPQPCRCPYQAGAALAGG